VSESKEAKRVQLPVSAIRLNPETLGTLNDLKRACEFPNLDALLMDMIMVYTERKEVVMDGANTTTS